MLFETAETTLMAGLNLLSNSHWHLNKLKHEGHLAIRRVFALIAQISKTEFSNCPDVFVICMN